MKCSCIHLEIPMAVHLLVWINSLELLVLGKDWKIFRENQVPIHERRLLFTVESICAICPWDIKWLLSLKSTLNYIWKFLVVNRSDRDLNYHWDSNIQTWKFILISRGIWVPMFTCVSQLKHKAQNYGGAFHSFFYITIIITFRNIALYPHFRWLSYYYVL